MRHLAACALGSKTPSFLVGKDSKKPRVVELSPLASGEATRILGDLVRFFWLGQRVALPYVPVVSAAYAEAILGGKALPDALDVATGKYDAEPGEYGYDPHAVRAFDQRLPPFDAAFERRERPVEATLFHEVALVVHQSLYEAGGKLG
jgi:exonuclease V gamma subunit